MNIKVLFLNGYHHNIPLINSPIEMKVYNVYDIEITACTGCFTCWRNTKNQGTCIRKDITEEIKNEFISSDCVIILSPVEFGSYNYHIKKVLDRLIPLIPPLFRIVDHQLQQDLFHKNYPYLYVIGIDNNLSVDEMSSFQSLVEKNAKTFHSPKWNVSFYQKTIIQNELEKVVANLLELGD